jgi:hypothetical protein
MPSLPARLPAYPSTPPWLLGGRKSALKSLDAAGQGICPPLRFGRILGPLTGFQAGCILFGFEAMDFLLLPNRSSLGSGLHLGEPCQCLGGAPVGLGDPLALDQQVFPGPSDLGQQPIAFSLVVGPVLGTLPLRLRQPDFSRGQALRQSYYFQSGFTPRRWGLIWRFGRGSNPRLIGATTRGFISCREGLRVGHEDQGTSLLVDAVADRPTPTLSL